MEVPGESAGIVVVHAIPGRARVRIESLRGNPAVATRLGERLRHLPGMRRVEASVVTGTVLLVYDPDDLRWLEELPEAAGAPGVDVTGVRPRLEAAVTHAGNGERPGAQVSSFFGALNERVGDATGGFDLKLLVPALLVLFGLRSFVVSENARTPTWYDLLWFGFGTFVMLNARPETGTTQATPG